MLYTFKVVLVTGLLVYGGICECDAMMRSILCTTDRTCAWLKEKLVCGCDNMNPFKLVHRDKDDYFKPDYVGLSHILCDKFQGWYGYTLTDLMEKSKLLPIKEQSPWEQWEFNNLYVFLGYRGTDSEWAQIAARDQYQVNPWGIYSYGKGIYASPHRKTALEYSHSSSFKITQRRICYNFAPKRILDSLLVCGVCHHKYNAAGSTQRIKKPPKEVSLRYSDLYYEKQKMPVAVTYPQLLLPYVKVMCIEAPDEYQQIPALFQWNNFYYDPNTGKIQMHLISLEDMQIY